MCKILILDDNKNLVDTMILWLLDSKIILSKEEVVSATNVVQAKNIILDLSEKNIMPVILFVDIILGGSEIGLDFIKWFNNNRYISTIYVITGSDISFDNLKLLTKLGVDGIFKKPLNFDNIILNIYSTLNKLKLKEKLFVNIRLKEIHCTYIKSLDNFLGELKKINSGYIQLQKMNGK